jgi:hypothetical protein
MIEVVAFDKSTGLSAQPDIKIDKLINKIIITEYIVPLFFNFILFLLKN